MKIIGMKDCVERYAQKRGITKAQAETEFKTALDVIADACVKDGGVAFKGLFTLKQKIQKGREGAVNGVAYKTDDKTTLKISVGSELEAKLNS